MLQGACKRWVDSGSLWKRNVPLRAYNDVACYYRGEVAILISCVGNGHVLALGGLVTVTTLHRIGPELEHKKTLVSGAHP